MTEGAQRVSDLPARLYAARLRARARWRRLSVTLTVAACLLALIGYLLLWHTSLIAVRGIKVAGVKSITAAQVLTAAQIGSGGPMAALNTAAAAARIERIPQVASANVRKDWPGTVVITVTERQPAALVPDARGYQVVDSGGVVFGQVAKPSKGLPVITVSAPAKAADVVPGALAALRALPSGVSKQISAITASDPYAITLRFTDGATVNWGGGDDAVDKARDLVALLRIGGGRHYDVSAPDAPAMS
ncbi:FtsQ-type POTRA domain-containing protein [Actinospica sp. MGRD01-02]|uniref:FtsQ-type POTRA domain-containing protein n=1 Tax=Actinospica acidithermotolerans TaxID=2828514 RepID=A0A941EDT3_9ACTN|nr:FtsQ-type POTRA domain-containing protein [Actinospica acidithermotolerans]MBR7828595.1 FtsQ-type POTRA domain-containing protein [Actinospica acidithermotolerans]